jgi:hypothetical protein
MSDKLKFKPDKLFIVHFKLLQGQIENPEDFDIEKVQGYQISNEFHVGFNLDAKQAKADLVLNLLSDSDSKNSSEAKARFHFVYIFKIDNLEELASQDNGGLVVDGALINAIASIVYSTSRGVLLTRLQGTALQNFILPVIDPNKLLHKEEPA